jgi:hypothetical protein
MKKRNKKLVLHRETLTALDRLNLGEADGGTGVSAHSCYMTCNSCQCTYSDRGTCGTCEVTCTTNYC